jgi:hypothetical protein
MYDDFSDRLMISCNEGDVVGSLRFLNLNIDFLSGNKIANIELIKASSYLKSIGINPRILESLNQAKIMFKPCRNGYLIYFILKAGKNIERIPYNIQAIEKPLLIQ